MNLNRKPHIGRELAIVALAYTVLTVVVTWPVVAHLSDAVAGFDGRDSFQHIWLFWRYWDALLNKGQLPSQIDVLYFPQGAFHPVLWLHPLAALLGLPLTGLLGPLLAYNLVLLISFVLVGIVGYLLMRFLSRDSKAAFIGGLIFAFAPNRMGHVLAGHLLLVLNFALPLYALSLCLWLKRPSWGLSSLYAISLTLVLLSHPNFMGYFLLLVTPILLAAHWSRQGWFSRSQWKQLFLCWVVSGLLFLPFAWPTLNELAGRGLAYLGTEDVGEHSADLVAFFLPSPFHPWWGNNPPAFVTLALDSTRALEEGFNYIGLAGLVLAGIAVRRGWSQVGPWLVIACLAMLFSLGPVLKAGGHVTQFTMPYAFIGNLPFFSWSRTPARLAMTTMLGVSVLASMGVAYIMSWCRRQACGWGLLVGLTGFIVFEYLPLWPFPVEFRPVSPYYHQLGQVRVEEGLLDMPVSGSRRASNYAMYYQTIHQRPLVGGYIERDPPGTEELRLFADRLLSPSDFSDNILLSPTPLQRVAVLRHMRVTEVIAHPGLMTDQAARATLAFMRDILGTPNYVDDDLLAWHVPAVEDILPPYMLLLSEEGWESAGDSSIVRLKQEGLLFVYAAQAGPAALTLDLQSQLSPGQQLWINDSALDAASSERSHLPLHLEAGLNWLRFRLTGCEDCSVDLSYIAVE